MEDSKVPDGFLALVKMVMKQQPLSSYSPKNAGEIWQKFLKIVFMGGNRSDAEVNYILEILGTILDIDYVAKTGGEALDAELSRILRGRKEKDEHLSTVLSGLENDLFRVVASLKGSARYFKRVKMDPAFLEKATNEKEKTWEYIMELVEDEDVTNIKFTKVILWLHSVGCAPDFAPPSRQIKDFCNKDIGPYYRFYEDDKYFMEMMKSYSHEIKKKIPKCSVYDVSKAAFYYRVCKGMLKNPRGFQPSSLMRFMKKGKLDLPKLSRMLGDIKKRNLLEKKLNAAFT